MELDAQAVIAELQRQITILSMRAAEFAAMADSAQKQAAQAQSQLEQKPVLKSVE